MVLGEIERAPQHSLCAPTAALQTADRILFYVLLGDRIVRGAHRTLPPAKPAPEMIPPSAVYAILPTWVDKLYRAAGVLAYSYDENGRLVFLLAEEARISKQAKGRSSFWNLLGGKRESCDRFAEDTAVREFMEETSGAGRVFHAALIASLASAECLRTWQAEGKFVLFITPLPYVAAFPAMFAKAVEANATVVNPDCLTRQMRWVSASELFAAAYPEHYPPCGDVGSFYPFLLQMLRTEGTYSEIARLLVQATSAPVWTLNAPAPPQQSAFQRV